MEAASAEDLEATPLVEVVRSATNVEKSVILPATALRAVMAAEATIKAATVADTEVAVVEDKLAILAAAMDTCRVSTIQDFDCLELWLMARVRRLYSRTVRQAS